MEGMFTFVGIIIILFGVLQIILFFKIWGMTDDVDKIKNTIQANGYPNGVSSAKIEYAIGNTEKAQEMVNREFVCEVYKLYLFASRQLDSSKDKAYTGGFNDVESKYREMFDNTSTFIEFSKFSTFEKAKKIFH